MPEWLTTDFDSNPTKALTTEAVIARLLAAAIFGGIVCLVYRISFGKRKSDSLPFGITLVLLSCLVAMTTLIIGNNAALAFSLVGTLSIVRFRTAMDDTRDTAFVIFAVAVGMGSAVGAMRVVLVGVPIVCVVVWISSLVGRRIQPHGPDRTLAVRFGPAADTAVLEPYLERLFNRHQLLGIESVKNGELVELTYQVRFRTAAMLPVVAELRTVPGVTAVEIKAKGA